MQTAARAATTRSNENSRILTETAIPGDYTTCDVSMAKPNMDEKKLIDCFDTKSRSKSRKFPVAKGLTKIVWRKKENLDVG